MRGLRDEIELARQIEAEIERAIVLSRRQSFLSAVFWIIGLAVLVVLLLTR